MNLPPLWSRLRRWLTATDARYRDATIYTLIGAVAALALADKYAGWTWAGYVGWALFVVLAGYSGYWIVRFVAVLTRRG